MSNELKEFEEMAEDFCPGYLGAKREFEKMKISFTEEELSKQKRLNMRCMTKVVDFYDAVMSIDMADLKDSEKLRRLFYLCKMFYLSYR